MTYSEACQESTKAEETLKMAMRESTPIFTVMNTNETLPDGVWFRNSPPHTADAIGLLALSAQE